MIGGLGLRFPIDVGGYQITSISQDHARWGYVVGFSDNRYEFVGDDEARNVESGYSDSDIARAVAIIETAVKRRQKRDRFKPEWYAAYTIARESAKCTP